LAEPDSPRTLVGMPRKSRIEYVGAYYHVMSRGDRQEAIFRDHADRPLFCGRRLNRPAHALVTCGAFTHESVFLELPEFEMDSLLLTW